MVTADTYGATVNVGRPRPWVGPSSLTPLVGTTAREGLDERAMPYGPGGGRQPSRLGPFGVSGFTG